MRTLMKGLGLAGVVLAGLAMTGCAGQEPEKSGLAAEYVRLLDEPSPYIQQWMIEGDQVTFTATSCNANLVMSDRTGTLERVHDGAAEITWDGSGRRDDIEIDPDRLVWRGDMSEDLSEVAWSTNAAEQKKRCEAAEITSEDD
jgi:hypothetical protein